MNPPSSAPATTGTPVNTGFGAVRDLGRRLFGYTLLFSFFSIALSMAVPLNMFAMYSLVIPSQEAANALTITAAAVALLALMGIVMDIRSRLMIRFGLIVNQTLSDKVILGMLQDAAERAKHGFSEAMADLGRVRNFLSSPAVFAYFDCLLVPVQLLIIYLLSPLLALVALVALLLIVAMTWRLERLTRQPLREANALAARNNSFLQECLRNQEAVRSMGMTPALTRRWQQTHDATLTQQFTASEQAGMLTAISKTITMGMPILMLGIGAGQVIGNTGLQPIMVIIASMLAGQMLNPLHRAISGWSNLQDTMQAYERLKELFAALEQQPERMELPPPEGRLSTEQVGYGFPGHSLLQGVSLELEPGEMLGIIGPMAAGKTTLARILTGVVKPVVGKVRLDGADMHIWDQSNLGRYLGYLPQEVELFPGSIEENITRMAPPEDEKLATALRRTGLDQVVSQLPEGLQTVIADRGGNLPGGLRQRIGLARALYGDPKLIILDEPDANLDQEGRRYLLEALGELRDLKITVVMVTHRISLINKADKILMLRDGLVVMYGPAAEVWAKLAAARQQQKILAPGK